ncbi:hypothetical protein Pan181_28960 [Aeoliella mucimassa]|uniref:Uncharacterized protein n=1 Tax=Aeoliella mucimassa TaxID=2527972 RepID=A0A518APN7_9BACT|nr:hypothetical protein Pan181_28960 [Aeoliella mucimassa]
MSPIGLLYVPHLCFVWLDVRLQLPLVELGTLSMNSLETRFEAIKLAEQALACKEWPVLTDHFCVETLLNRTGRDELVTDLPLSVTISFNR